MWRAIRDALRALGKALSRTTSAFAQGFWATDAWLTDLYNRWARLISGTAYRPDPVHDVQDTVSAIVERRPETVPAYDDAALGEKVRTAIAHVLCGDQDAGADLPDDVRVWILALDRSDLVTVAEASFEMIGRHATGKACIKGAGGRLLSCPDLERDLMSIRRREERLSRGISAHERERIEELFAVSATRRVEAEAKVDVEVQTAPRLVA